MKEYIYQDERLMQSLISQHSGGLLTSISSSTSQGMTDRTAEMIRGATVEGGMSFFGAQIKGGKESLDAEYSATHEEIGSYSNHMKAYDHAYDEFENILLQYSGFCKFEDLFRLVDLDVISATVESELIKESVLQSHEDKIKYLKSSTNREQKRNNPAYDTQLKKLEKEKEEQKTNFDRTKGLTAYATHILPSTCFLISKERNAIFPLIKKSLILEPNQVSFYYKNTKTHLLCKYVGSLKNNLATSQQDKFMAGFYGALDEVILKILNFFDVDQDTELYMPISWYEEHLEVD